MLQTLKLLIERPNDRDKRTLHDDDDDFVIEEVSFDRSSNESSSVNAHSSMSYKKSFLDQISPSQLDKGSIIESIRSPDMTDAKGSVKLGKATKQMERIKLGNINNRFKKSQVINPGDSSLKFLVLDKAKMNRRSGFTPSLQYESGEYKTKKEVLNEFIALSRHSNQEELARIMNNE